MKSVQPQLRHWQLPAAYDTSAFMLFKVAAVTGLAEWTAQLAHGTVNQYIICLVFGVIAHQLGFLEDAVLEKAGVFHWQRSCANQIKDGQFPS
ncbi:hypothetical protein WP50_33555 [Lactiplantibacillus plantarum]|nr:hypothetical protein WP50_33555 [Lactiplantibacillus plantarum]